MSRANRDVRALAALLLAALAALCDAGERVSGSFLLDQRCPAFQSFAKQTNPGDVFVEAGTRLDALEINRDAWTWVRVRVPDARPAERWVARECGTATFGEEAAAAPASRERQDAARSTPADSTAGPGASCDRTPGTYDSQVLALSWQPGFCAHAPRADDKPECEALARGKLKVEHLTLHGLWPNKRTCGIEYNDCANRPLDLSPAVRTQLAQWMPSLRYDDEGLLRHEWNKHGVCQARGADEYFTQAIDLARQVQDSPLGGFMMRAAGRTVVRDEVRAYLAREWSPAAAARVEFVCGGRGRHLMEVRLHLPARLEPGRSLVQWLEAGPSPGDYGGAGNCGARISIEGFR